MCILNCIKTGRWWKCESETKASRLAMRLGLKDYEIARC